MYKKYFCVIMALLISVILMTGCGEEKIVADGTDLPQAAGGTEELPRLTAEELNSSWVNKDMTVAELESSSEYTNKEQLEEGLYVSYDMGGYAYVYTSDWEGWENPNELCYVEITETNQDVIGPRGIFIGEGFEEVLAKFPVEKDWKTDEESAFYGEGEDSDGELICTDMGYVAADFENNEIIDFIAVIPQEELPFLKISFEDNKVSSIQLVYAYY